MKKGPAYYCRPVRRLVWEYFRKRLAIQLWGQSRCAQRWKTFRSLIVGAFRRRRNLGDVGVSPVCDSNMGERLSSLAVGVALLDCLGSV